MSSSANDPSTEFVRRNRLTAFQPVLWAGALLVGSGLLHFAWMAATGADWDDPLSPRKPALFGVSAGLTAWSIAWAMTKLVPRRRDRLLAGAMAGALLIEVGLITLQQWRGVPSHFNRATTFDAAVEAIMLGLILAVTAGIAWMTIRSIRLPPIDEATAIALRGGLALLTLSCGLGILITILGELNLKAGDSPETWGRARVLKYPHGAALHAIQTLPLLAWASRKLGVANPARLVGAALWAHVLFLLHAFWQTSNGRARFDLDWVGGAALAGAGILILFPIAALAEASIALVVAHRRRIF